MVRVSVEPARIELGLGSAVSVEVRVFNASEIIDHFSVTALGIDPAWVSVDVDRAQLEPGAETTVRLSISVPESARLTAGEHVVGIRVVSLSNPDDSAVEEVRLDVEGETSVAMTLQPSQLRTTRSARANLSVDNRGNRPVSLELSGSDPEAVASFTFTPEPLDVPPFTKRDAVVGVRLPRRWVGRELARTFTIEGRHADGSVGVAGSVLQRGVFAPWLVRTVMTALGLALVATVAMMITGSLGGDEDSDGEAAVTTTALTTAPETSTTAPEEPTGDEEATSAPPTTAQLVQVVDLAGLTVIEAQAWADGVGVQLSVSGDFVDVSSDSGLAGRIAEQSVAPGAQVEPGTPIGVALGSVPLVQVPEVLGLSEADAMERLTNAGLVASVDGTVVVDFLSDLRGAIAEQSPAAGTQVEQGSTVSLLVGRVELIIIPDERLLARYPLTEDGVDATGRNTDATLTNVTFSEGGIFCPGTHINLDPSGCEILTPLIDGFDFNRFSVHIEFRPTALQNGPVVVGGTSHRWIGFLLNDDGTTSLLYNNSGREQCNTDIRYRADEWNGAALTYDGTTAQLFLDGQLACEFAYNIEHANDANFGTGNYANGTVLAGWVRGLLVYDDVVAGGAG